MNELKENIESWDGKSTDHLKAIYDQFSAQSGFIDYLIELLLETDLQTASSWLIKHGAEQKLSFTTSQIQALYESSPHLVGWEPRLHLLQLMPYFSVPEDLKYDMFDFCRRATEDDIKFVRAWGYNGLFVVADDFPDLREGLVTVFNAALESEPASVKARLRHVMKKVQKSWA